MYTWHYDTEVNVHCCQLQVFFIGNEKTSLEYVRWENSARKTTYEAISDEQIFA